MLRMKQTIKNIVSGFLAAVMTMGAIPAISVSAAQANEYVDPADVWMEANGRINELDINATTTYETSFCPVCNMDTTLLIYRVPEYTRTGETALNRNVKFSDGTCLDGVSVGNCDSGTPGVDASYTGHHWTKSVCETCGTINANEGIYSHAFGKNVYVLYDCDSNFFLPFNNTTYTPYDSDYHTTTLKEGEYCQYCKGTYAVATTSLDEHNFTETIDPEIGHQRFHVTGTCDDCGYIKNEYVIAKSVIQSYYGKVDGETHTITVTDLSDSGVHTRIRYGTEADDCTLTSAPNYTAEGYYPIYYEIDYSYEGVSMTENGVSYVWLLDDNSSNSSTLAASSACSHSYSYLETVKPTCTELGYDRFQCTECGALMKTNYTAATGHSYNELVIREASCRQGGYVLYMCKTCGSYYTETTSMTDHTYTTTTVAATCTMNGYTQHTCVDCGYYYITDLTALASHDYREKVTAPTCTTRGFTTYTCYNCGDTYISDYTEATGHDWNNGTIVTNSTCESEGVIEYTCKDCGEKMIQAISASGHTPGAAATCTEPQVCTDCGAILELPKGHTYTGTITAPSCSAMGYTTYVCDDCGNTYVSDYTDKTAHHYHSVVTPATCTSMGYTTYTCCNCGDEYVSDYTDKLDHDYRAEITPATCTSMGYTTYTCADCGDSYVSDYTDVRPHNYTKKVVEPTCTEQGYTIYTCPDCGKEYIGDETEPIAHSYNADVTAPSCEEMGYTTYTCDDCGYSYVADYTNPTGHHYSAEVTAPTCTTIGYTTYTCVDCGKTYVGSETAKTEHDYNADVTAPTCTSMGYTTFTCKDCGNSYIGDYTDVIPHSYNAVITEPTCTEIGYTTYTCENCGKSYVGNETAKIPHNYEADVTEPTCTSMGYTTYTCTNCGYSYVGDYTDVIPHNYNAVITEPTCTSIGYTTYTCANCGKTYVGNETAKLPHNYEADVTEPTCTSMGYTTYVCADCGDTYVGDYTDMTGHDFEANVTQATCTSIGYTTYTCRDCGETYIADETAKTAHDYEITVVDPTCTELGYSIYTCADCGESYRADEIAATGHIESDWIIDIPATIENEGSKHIECLVCGAVLETEIIEQLSEKDNSDEDGHSVVGDYTILITDCSGKPIFDSEISIDTNDNITIVLPDGRLLSADDITTITVTKDKQPAEGVKIFISDTMNNAATGTTDENGQLSVPNKTSSTGDTNGTVADGENTYVVVVTDKNGALISNCNVEVGENYSINVTLPTGTAFNSDNRITVTVVTETGEPVEGLRVQLIGDGDYVENGYTNYNGQITLPMTDSDYTDENGNGEVGVIDGDKIYDYIVTVSDEYGFIENALITLVVDKTAVLVCLPYGSVIDYYNRITVKVVKSDGTPVEGWNVTVYNKDGSDIRTEVTDEGGIVIVPPLNEAPFAEPTETPTDEDTPLPGVDVTPTPDDDEEPTETPTETVTDPDLGDGSVVQNKDYKYRVYVWDNYGVITDFGLIKLQDNGDLIIELPENKLLDEDNKTRVKVVNENDGSAVKGITVTVYDVNGDEASDITNSYGIAIVPISDTDTTDADGNALVRDNEGNIYNVNVSTDEKGNIEGAVVSVSDGKIAVVLPDGTVIDYSDRITVIVTDRDNIPVENIPVNVKDNAGGDRTENTDANGVVVVPPRNEYQTNDDGNTGDITVPTETPDTEPSTDPDASDEPAEKTVTELNVTVEDEKGVIENAIVIYNEDGTLTVTLPDGKILDKDNRTKVTVTDQDNEPVIGIGITVNDNTGAADTDTTNKYGYIIVPVTDTDNTDESGAVVGEIDENGAKTQYTVIVENKDGNISDASVTIADGKISVVLPDDYTLTTSNQTTVTVFDKDLEPVKGISVTVTDKNKKTATKTTNANGQITVPVKSSGGGSSGGSSGSSSGGSYSSTTNIMVVDKDGKSVSVSKSTKDGVTTLTLPTGTTLDGSNYYTITVTDGSGNAKSGVEIALQDKDGNILSGTTDENGQLVLPPYSEHAAYVVGYEDGTFRPEGNMTRAEAAAIFARNISDLKGKKISGTKSSFSDVASNLWYSKYIAFLEDYDVIEGYDDGTFRPDEQITRAEFVTMCVRFYELIDDVQKGSTNKFSDVERNHWAYGYINSAVAMDWIEGYSDKTFRPDNNITRAEVVAIVNRVTEREADTDYITENISELNTFSDVKDKSYWAYYDIFEAANEHRAITLDNEEAWIE